MYVAIWIFVSTHSRSENLLFLSLAHRADPPLLSSVQPLTGSIAKKAQRGCGLTKPAAVADVLLARLTSLGVLLFRDFT